jgi:predicted RNA-binding protein
MSLLDDALTRDIEKDQLREALRRAQRDLEKAKARREEYVAVLYQAAKDAASVTSLPPIPTPPVDTGEADPEVAICLLADWQLGKITPTYSSAVAVERMHRFADKVVRLIGLHRTAVPVREARVYMLGDICEGELVFPGQAHRIDASLYRQLFDGAELLSHVVRTIAASVEKVKVVGVIGNHGEIGGRSRRDMHPETNADAMLYNIARLSVQDPRVEWEETLVADERAWVAFDEVLGKRWLLAHMNQVKGSSFGFPWYGMAKKLQGWHTALGAYDYAAGGHWHTPVRFTVSSITYWGAGSPESSNTYAQEWIASGGQGPTQGLIFQGRKGVTAEYTVRL